MIKEINYTGCTASPSDYRSPDGDLALALNLIPEDGALRPLGPPRVEMRLHEGHHPLLIHSVQGQENLIILTGDRDGDFGLSWIERHTSETTEGATPIDIQIPLSQLRDISIVGNTLAVATGSGVFYILWKDDSYRFLGDRPPFVPVSFGVYQKASLTQTNTATYNDVPAAICSRYADQSAGSGASRPHGTGSPEDNAFWRQVSDQAIGLLLGNVAEKVTSCGYVYQPFYIRYAFRLYDGSYSWQSAPVLMLVSTHSPVIHVTITTGSGNTMTVACQLDIPYFAISYRISGDLDALAQWSDIVTGLDVFISSPIYTYKQDGAAGPPMARYHLYDNIYEGGGHRGRPAADTGEGSVNVLTGHYGTSVSGPYTDRFISVSKYSMQDLVWALETPDNFNDKIQHEYLFYKVASFDISELQQSDSMESLPLIKADLSDISTLETLPDDYNSHATIIPSSLYTYNQRLVMAGISIKPPKPFPMSAMAQAATMSAEALAALSPGSHEIIRVFTRVNGRRCVSQSIRDTWLYPFDECFPRFIYHPDASAYRMEITGSDGKFYSLPLKPHPYLSGAYWFGGLGEEPTGITDDSDDTTAESGIVGSKVYISEVNNPFFFPLTGIVTVPAGRILAICSAAKALSQGQFGQFPLYAFTDEGIWALELSSTGTISARQPITRDICSDPAAITQLDSAVLFPSDRGIMLISGSQTQCITDTLGSPGYFSFTSLPGLCERFPQFPYPDCRFADYIRHCRMAYDYICQRIILFNPSKAYAYVYSLKSKLWGMQQCSLSSAINSYPGALAIAKVDEENYLVDLSRSDAEAVPCLLVTRPLKLGAPDVLKTVTATVQRGILPRGKEDAATILYGSRDYVSWHLIGSSRGLSLRSFRGTPYKAFRIVSVATLTKGESMAGCSLDVVPRLTNRLR